ncbi:hypothetical protein OTU49_013942 [Cherax quadricarinatus]|uniref:Uncharacterized protein n=1 Tax=Cherax quadricarinatus TaxID=27406 RepID=A0AAW0VRA2_CHEQU
MQRLVILAVVVAAVSAIPVGRFAYVRDDSLEHGVRDVSLEYVRPVRSQNLATFRSAVQTGFPYTLSSDEAAVQYFLSQNAVAGGALTRSAGTHDDRVRALGQMLSTGIYDVSEEALYRNPALRAAIAQGDGQYLINNSGELYYHHSPGAVPASGVQPQQAQNSAVTVAKKK